MDAQSRRPSPLRRVATSLGLALGSVGRSLGQLGDDAVKMSGLPGPQGLPPCLFCGEWDQFLISPARYGVNWFYSVDFLTHQVRCMNCGVKLTAYRRANKNNWTWFEDV